ncbi:hypothetical protein L226DRAFT_615705 [Lentinus tigrinus ALCF2SS1-7]|uniref:Uncharacterized protein n=1 Tax=Lentinus tigrinus ALCF2SS1-6 TaxID=1328759 RepID=A0A5C2S0L1_9APHY|nr:hypothetical protein L227DRAFT_655947 [Lentinus tigrinus ALCF2SS1-6]RPD71197.1 hypothetical protein L226DRAFT_615705 [Lentinus tigrinus ALCF2SS1-7]
MPRTTVTKAQLEELVATLRAAVEAAQHARDVAAGELETTRQALTTAQAEATSAQEAAAAAQAASTALQQQLQNAPPLQGQLAGGGPGGVAMDPAPVQANLPQIDRPVGTRWSIHEAMQLSQAEYAEVQRTIRSLVIRAQLDWTEDFRRQDADRLGTLFRAARAAHPILRRYTNNWATAAIARQYMSNKRKHAYKQGYIKKRGACADKENLPGPSGQRRREDEGDRSGGAGAVA